MAECGVWRDFASRNLGTMSRGYAICFRSQRCATASQTQSVNNRFRSGKSGSPLTKKSNRSQSSSPGHSPFQTSRRGSFGSKCKQPSACQPQRGQRSMSQPARWRSPIRAPQSGQGPSFLRRLPCPHQQAQPSRTQHPAQSSAGHRARRWSICATRAGDQNMVPLGGQALGRAVTAISPLTRSLDGAATLFRTRPLPCHHPLNSNWDGSLISTRSHWRICSRTTEANASRFSAQIAKRWEPGLASDGVMVTIGFTCPGPHVLATVGYYGY
jgi:hypothetical protein